MPANQFAVQGLKELQRKLHELGALEGGKVLRSAAGLALNPAMKQARARIPTNDRDYLQKTYKGRKVSPGFAKRNIAKKTRISRDKSTVWADLGVKSEAFYAINFVELGTSKQRRQPWLEPSFRRNRETMVAKIRDAVRRKILLIAKKRGRA